MRLAEVLFALERSPAVVAALAGLPYETIIDGEMVALEWFAVHAWTWYRSSEIGTAPDLSNRIRSDKIGRE